MSKQLRQSDRPTASEKPQPEQQDALDMLANWIEMGRNLGMNIETLYNPTRARFTVRVYNVHYEDGEIKREGEP